MKKYAYKLIPVLCVVVLFSCTSDNEFGEEQSARALNFRMVPSVPSIDISAGDPDMTFTMYSENNNIDRVTILVELLQFANNELTPRATLSEIDGGTITNDGSSQVTFALSDFTSVLGLSNDDLNGGDIFTVYNIVTMEDGTVYPDTIELGGEKFLNIEQAFVTAGATTSFTTNLSFPVLCPFVVSDAVGMYALTRDDLEASWDPNYQPEVVAGPEPNQVIFKNMFGHPQGYDIVVDVNPVTDVATVKKQVAWHSGNFGLPYGEASVEGSGLYFSCTGFITLDLEHTVSAGSFGTYKVEFTKVP